LCRLFWCTLFDAPLFDAKVGNRLSPLLKSI
jgi:hypothetical protein